MPQKNEPDEVSLQRRIANGYESPERPFYVKIIFKRDGYYTFCGGAIISPSRVLSSANCFKNEDS